MTSDGPRSDARRVRAAYDTVAQPYATSLRGELSGKPLDRALLKAVVEMAQAGHIADVGCGPGHVTAYLRECGADAVGIDLSRSMIEIAQSEHPQVPFVVESMTALSAPDESYDAAVLLYSIIHLSALDRDAALRETFRVLRPGGVALISFHIRSEDVAAGQTSHQTSWFGRSVDLEFHFLEPEAVMDELGRAGFDVVSVTTRMPHPGIEVQTERAYLLAQRPLDDESRETD